MRSLALRLINASRIVTMLALAAMLTSASWAQVQPAPAPTLRNAPAPWIGYLLMAVLVGIVIGISMMPSKRSHQD